MDKMFKKSQAAMEFLMTYGWAILVVLVAIGALAYFGVLSPDKFLPAKCQLPAGIACTDHRVSSTANTVEVVLRNGMGFDATGVSVSIGGCGTATAIAAGDCAAGATRLNNGAQCTYRATCTPPLSSGAKFSGGLGVAYTNADTNLAHVINGTITSRAD
jgi:uncharacterized protein (UPF0333 family)